ncbi:MAG: preprotein translocase subunit YajC, partial [Gammaproteobacteria bacterium]|nr:preprotein translocase subunit YajC [Gammaproteobacteria bacterium]
MTTGGMVGKISKLGDNFADLDTGNTKITIQRQSIAGLMPKDALKDY